jgi:hypothetical protein
MLGWDIYGISERLNVAKAQAESFNVLRRGDHDGRLLLGPSRDTPELLGSIPIVH